MNAVKEYLQYLEKVRVYSQATITAYAIDLEGFLDFASSEGFRWQDADSRLIRAWVGSLLQAGRAKTSVNRALSCARGFYRYANTLGLIRGNPADLVHSLKPEKKLPGFLFYKEIEELLEQTKGRDFVKVRDRLLVEMLYSTGCRAAELISMTTGRIDLSKGFARIQGKGSKERIVFLGKPALDALNEYLPLRSEKLRQAGSEQEMRLFLNQRAKPLTTRGLSHILHGYTVKLGTAKKVSPHTFRHTFATHILDQGADIRTVQELLGHAGLSTTQIYTHLSIDGLKQTHRNAHPHARRT